MPENFDVVVVGAGIVGLAHAYAAARMGKRVAVVERDARAIGASFRNFGFVTITGQATGETWRRALRSRDVWMAVAQHAGIVAEQRGLLVTLRLPESLAVAESFLATEMGEGCALLSRQELLSRFPGAYGPSVVAALHSPHEMRVESRTAIPLLAKWLALRWRVEFRYETAVTEVDLPHVATSRGALEADAVFVCPGDDFASLFPERIARYGPTKCRLSMLRLGDPGLRLPAALMSDLGLVRYLGYAELPQAKALRERLQTELPEHLAHGVHLIVVQSADGSLVVGDSHHYDPAPEPFAAAETEALILDELGRATGLAHLPVIERWTGTYASAPDRAMFVDAPSPRVRIVVVTSGTGASTAFAIAEEVVGEMFGQKIGEIS
jgi:D-hydroxyproline dehydrogenase subunit beta